MKSFQNTSTQQQYKPSIINIFYMLIKKLSATIILILDNVRFTTLINRVKI